MKREDIELRRAARGGDVQACLAMARKLFAGDDGMQRNVNLGLAYLQHELAGAHPEALGLVARCVPLEAIVAQRLRAALSHAIAQGCSVARLKMGIWLAMSKASRGEALALMRASGIEDPEMSVEAMDSPRTFAGTLAALPPDILDPGRMALLCARDALEAGDLAGACYCLELAAEFPHQDESDELICRVVYLAARGAHPLELQPALVEAALRRRSDKGEIEPQYVLGCALAGIPYGSLAAGQLVKQPSPSRAAGLLLRAADGGKHDAWLDLFHTAHGARSGVAGNEVARFFLEKGARSGLVNAQTRLGVLLLAEATSVQAAEEAVGWLAGAAQAGDTAAAEVLNTLVLPIPELPADYERGALEKISALDRDLGMRMALARGLHLTRHEALSFNPARDMRPWGLALAGSSKENPKGRLAPAVGAQMKLELERVRAFYGNAAPVEGSLMLQRARAQKRVFEMLSISQAMFFAGDIGRSWSHYGYGRHWASRTTDVVHAVLRANGRRPRTEEALSA
jgi:TPR repeat protein